MIKNLVLSLLAGYAVTTFPIWEIRDNLWLVGLIITAVCLDLLIKLDERKERKWKRDY